MSQPNPILADKITYLLTAGETDVDKWIAAWNSVYETNPHPLAGPAKEWDLRSLLTGFAQVRKRPPTGDA